MTIQIETAFQEAYLKAGVHLKPVFLPLNLVNANISSAFQVIQKFYAHFTFLFLFRGAPAN